VHDWAVVLAAAPTYTPPAVDVVSPVPPLTVVMVGRSASATLAQVQTPDAVSLLGNCPVQVFDTLTPVIP
jgi:hypothetical protein